MLTNNLLQGRGGGVPTTGDSFILVMHQSPLQSRSWPRQPLQHCSIEFDRFLGVLAGCFV